MKQKYKKILSLIGLSFFVANLVFVAATPVMIYAQAVPTPAATPPPTSTAPISAGEGEQSIAAYLCVPGTGLYPCINRLYRFALAAAFFITVLFIVFAGYQYMLGGEKGKEDAKGRISAAVIAIVILSTSFILLRQINPDLVKFKNISPLPVNLVSKLDDLDPNRGGDIPTLDEWDDGQNSTGTGTPGADIKECAPPGPIPIPKDISNSSDTEKACPTLIAALTTLKSTATSSGVTFEVTDAFGNGHQSICHRVSGTCADIAMRSGSWEKLCVAVKATGQFRLWNEYKGNDAPSCGTYHSGGSGPHLHIVLVGTADDIDGGGSDSGFSTGPSGSRPNCALISGAPGMCGHPSGTAGRYKDGDFTNTKPELRPAYDNLKKAFSGITLDQVYRSPEYGAHMRSVFEGKALLSGWTEAEVRSYGQYCQTKGIQYVTAEDVKNENTKAYIAAHFNDHFTSLASPTTCDSDHGQGIAFDVNGSVNSTKAAEFGLCHSVPVFTVHGTTMNQDTRHWALFKYLPNGRSSCVSY